MLRDADGNRLFRKVEVKILFPENIFPPRLITEKAGPHTGFGPDNIDQILMAIADKLETLYPYWDFEAKELAPQHRTARYVLTFAGYRAAVTTPTEESKALGAEAEVSDITTSAIESAVGTQLQEAAASATGDQL